MEPEELHSSFCVNICATHKQTKHLQENKTPPKNWNRKMKDWRLKERENPQWSMEDESAIPNSKQTPIQVHYHHHPVGPIQLLIYTDIHSQN